MVKNTTENNHCKRGAFFLIALLLTALSGGCSGTGNNAPPPASALPPITADLTEFAAYFPFSADSGQKYLLLYAGEGDDLTALRTAFEREKLSDMTDEQLAKFEVCDLGGDALILLVPKYKGLSVWINEIEHQGSMMTSGPEVARFESGLPVYIYCDFSDMLPEHEIHIFFDGTDQFFTTRETLLTSIKP